MMEGLDALSNAQLQDLAIEQVEKVQEAQQGLEAVMGQLMLRGYAAEEGVYEDQLPFEQITPYAATI